jgi:hypothetical protein
MSGNTDSEQSWMCCTTTISQQPVLYFNHPCVSSRKAAIQSLGNGPGPLGTTPNKHTVHSIVVLIQMLNRPIPLPPLRCADQDTQMQACPSHPHRHGYVCADGGMCVGKGQRARGPIAETHALQQQLLLLPTKPRALSQNRPVTSKQQRHSIHRGGL